jgi:hypothetical protein
MCWLNRSESSRCEKRQGARRLLHSDKRVRWFADILDKIARIERFTAGFDLNRFVGDERASFAVLHALMIISEAARRLGQTPSPLRPVSSGVPSAALATSYATNTRASIWARSGRSSAEIYPR